MTPDMLDASLGMKKKKSKDIKKKRAPSSGKRKTNPWIEHIQWYRKEHPELSYKEAMKQCKPSWLEKKKNLLNAKPKDEEKPKSDDDKKKKAKVEKEKEKEEKESDDDKSDKSDKSDKDEEEKEKSPSVE